MNGFVGERKNNASGVCLCVDNKNDYSLRSVLFVCLLTIRMIAVCVQWCLIVLLIITIITVGFQALDTCSALVVTPPTSYLCCAAFMSKYI